MRRLIQVMLLCFASIAPGYACDVTLVKTSNAWVRPSEGGMSAVYITLANDSTETITLHSVASDVGMASLHETAVDAHGVASMQEISSLPIKAKQTVAFAPGGRHIMLDALKHPLKIGDKVHLTLYFDEDASMNLTIPVADKPGQAEMHHDHHMM